MAYPTAYTSAVAIPLPSEQVVQQIMGKSYDPVRTLNVLKMFAGTTTYTRRRSVSSMQCSRRKALIRRHAR